MWKKKIISSSHLLVVSSAFTFAPKVAKTINVEELTIEEWNLICLSD
jgi:hypothetical protein